MSIWSPGGVEVGAMLAKVASQLAWTPIRTEVRRGSLRWHSFARGDHDVVASVIQCSFPLRHIEQGWELARDEARSLLAQLAGFRALSPF